ncbi:MAG: gamma-glutamylcyclotransferase [Gammaproteobacteria bacterium]|nr:gamma-glutamylcyclotransferase [Gammaproteobacteria bacterium]MCI0590974.1 gamma-glutamylcyclotransferase [Gammaproteobacteria bacterium]
MRKEAKKYLFVYGTLRKALAYPLHRILAMHAEFIGDAILAGRLYDVGDHPAVVPSIDHTDVVHGELYYLREPQRILKRLDRYEGCIGPTGRRAEYRREGLEVILNNTGERVRAWVYLYNLPTDDLNRIHSGDYLQWLGKEKE